MTDGKLRVGFIVGNDFDRTIQFDQEGVVYLEGNNDAGRVLALLPAGEFNHARIHIAPSYFRKARRWNIADIDIFWNMVSDADMHPATLAAIEKFTGELDIPVIDPARAILQTRRHHIASRLAAIDNVHMPKTLLLRNPTLERVERQVEEAGFQFPGIVRRTGTHNGELVGVFQSPGEITGVYGDRRQEYYLTEFVDVRHRDGLYRKSRFFFVGDDVVVRQHIVADHWNIHGRSSREMSNRADWLEESRAAIEAGYDGLPAVTKLALNEIGARVGLDYFGLDASLDPNGRLTVFEANATMNFVARSERGNSRNAAAMAPMIAGVRRLLLCKAAQRATKT
ncbi:hypothetical protein [Phenylobacterium sp.]|uniref:hypothetical protein n=1 Tax=Phenylobacterium sp. TaxID=1871053 RepID=UPI002724628C|nr:hypothetical protein [Phenylobacterium sp.]MDO8379096.1 hypothetical protein [Phenylobacterium sp.]